MDKINFLGRACPRIVCVGGGTGMPNMLKGLKDYTDWDITGIVTVTDDGGGSGVIRDQPVSYTHLLYLSLPPISASLISVPVTSSQSGNPDIQCPGVCFSAAHTFEKCVNGILRVWF